MASLTNSQSNVCVVTVSWMRNKQLKQWKYQNLFHSENIARISNKHLSIFCSNTSRWEPAPITYASDDEGKLLKEPGNIFENLDSSKTAQALTTLSEELEGASNQQFVQLQHIRWPVWLLGPALLLATGMVPTLWLPLSSIFLGPNVASLLSLIGLDCIFNLGAFLFLLMADFCARPKSTTQDCISKPPFSYQFWNTVANVIGFIIPLAMLFGSQKGLLQTQLPLISFAVLLGPYLLLLTVQIITELLTWHWRSPVWLVTPVVYEAYRLLQLMRGLKLGAELSAPPLMMHTIRGLVCCWVLVLGVQLMRVAWYAGFTAHTYQQQS